MRVTIAAPPLHSPRTFPCSGRLRSASIEIVLTIAATAAAAPGPTIATCAKVAVTSPSCTSSEKMN